MERPIDEVLGVIDGGAWSELEGADDEPVVVSHPDDQRAWIESWNDRIDVRSNRIAEGQKNGQEAVSLLTNQRLPFSCSLESACRKKLCSRQPAVHHSYKFVLSPSFCLP